jgi:hypothetical protein
MFLCGIDCEGNAYVCVKRKFAERFFLCGSVKEWELKMLHLVAFQVAGPFLALMSAFLVFRLCGTICGQVRRRERGGFFLCGKLSVFEDNNETPPEKRKKSWREREERKPVFSASVRHSLVVS